MVRELLVALEQQAGPGREELDEGWEATQGEAEQSLRHKLDELARLAAAQQSELEARAWRIGELERAIEPREAPSTSTSSSREVDRLRDEISALRQALTQEHADKQRIASDPRADLQRQAVLIEQLSGRKGEQDRA